MFFKKKNKGVNVFKLSDEAVEFIKIYKNLFIKRTKHYY